MVSCWFISPSSLGVFLWWPFHLSNQKLYPNLLPSTIWPLAKMLNRSQNRPPVARHGSMIPWSHLAKLTLTYLMHTHQDYNILNLGTKTLQDTVSKVLLKLRWHMQLSPHPQTPMTHWRRQSGWLGMLTIFSKFLVLQETRNLCEKACSIIFPGIKEIQIDLVYN